MPRYRQQYDGDWVRPVMNGYLMKCCDCNLVHKLNFRVIRWGRGHKVEFQAFRHKPATARARKRKVKV